jgi:hypothetical protein
MVPPIFLEARDDGTVIKTRIQANAKNTGITGIHDGALKIGVARPAVDGKANNELRRYLAKILDVNRAGVVIISGEQSRTKRIKVMEMEFDVVAGRLSKFVCC